MLLVTRGSLISKGWSVKPEAAAAVFAQYTQEDVDRIIKAMVLAGLRQAQHLAAPGG